MVKGNKRIHQVWEGSKGIGAEHSHAIVEVADKGRGGGGSLRGVGYTGSQQQQHTACSFLWYIAVPLKRKTMPQWSKELGDQLNIMPK